MLNRNDLPPIIKNLLDEFAEHDDLPYWYPLNGLKKEIPVVCYDLDAIYRTDNISLLKNCLKKASISCCDVFVAQTPPSAVKRINILDKLYEKDSNNGYNLPWCVEAFYYDGESSDWIIYVSHEGTITFTGQRIVDIAKDTIRSCIFENRYEAITTSRLEIRPFTEDCKNELSELLINPEIKKTYMIPDLETDVAFNKMLDRFFELSKLNEYFVRGIFLGERLIGFVNDVERQDKTIELGYAIHPSFWGQGYATEMLSAVIDELLCTQIQRIKAGAFIENTASIRVMEKCGMTKTDENESIEYRGKIHQCVYYEIIKNP